jgi:hypothetical protein
MDFERFLRQFLEAVLIASSFATVALALYSAGSVVIFWTAPPLRMEVGFFSCLAAWIISRWALRLIFPAEPKSGS